MLKAYVVLYVVLLQTYFIRNFKLAYLCIVDIKSICFLSIMKIPTHSFLKFLIIVFHILNLLSCEISLLGAPWILVLTWTSCFPVLPKFFYSQMLISYTAKLGPQCFQRLFSSHCWCCKSIWKVHISQWIKKQKKNLQKWSHGPKYFYTTDNEWDETHGVERFWNPALPQIL